MKNHGFTLIELVVTVMIVSILAAGAVPITQLTIQRNKETELKQALRQIREAIDLYKKAADEGKIKKTIDQTGYPPSLELLEQGVINQKDIKRKVIKFIRKIPRDPMSSDADIKPVETWAKRSYASDVNAPAEGADVFDVYSRSTKKAIDGTLYNTW
jgi:general secretion pathway protein G